MEGKVTTGEVKKKNETIPGLENVGGQTLFKLQDKTGEDWEGDRRKG